MANRTTRVANQPFCLLQPTGPGAEPRAGGILRIPPNANITQIINIVNNNFNRIIKGNYRENRAKRTSTITRIYDPQEPSLFVDVRQITNVEWVNPETGQTVLWSR